FLIKFFYYNSFSFPLLINGLWHYNMVAEVYSFYKTQEKTIDLQLKAITLNLHFDNQDRVRHKATPKPHQ
ncbi:hypothetical protein, partial [Herbaspirillum rubrisubalbicans]|uniref:hypothetical protein n=1 Tax=Herbaspirillum rubrisubalbicans TaxID=80842 RepID=UPI001ED99E82